MTKEEFLEEAKDILRYTTDGSNSAHIAGYKKHDPVFGEICERFYRDAAAHLKSRLEQK